ncbi:MAG TPA: nucleotide-binding domain containing protein [Chloroflexota bacterium]|nr:nucleotide-binding domain containing protein [Chloroflexota bacterium]
MLFVCGSLNPATGGQIGALIRARGLEPIEASARRAGPRAADALAGAGLALLCSGGTPAADPARVAARLGRRAREAARAARPDALVLTGGDTARAVLAALGARGIALRAELLPGVPLGRIVGGELDGVTVVTKAGGFGQPDTLVEVQRYLQEATR